MKICITGVGGQLGQDCHQVLEQGGHEVFAFTSQQLDISQAEQVQEQVGALQPEVLVNCAAYTAVDQCEQEQKRCLAVNGQGAANLADACALLGTRLIHISTDYVFDGKKSVPEAYWEQEPVGPLSAYGRSKLAGEQAIVQRLDNFLILRTAWLYGMGGNNFLKTMLRLALADSKRTIRVVNDQYGSLTWSMTLARQIARVLGSECTGIAHATAEQYSTWFTAAKYFLEAMEVEYSLAPCTTAEYPTPAPRPRNSILENRRLKERGLHLMQDWQADIDGFVALYHDQLLAGQ
ncbi:MAG: dTDP-4-dehydrorhamnose reductase [Candidatus Electrothrix sp. AR3]|nr:dTDP-4-dehydrorhamnose reductase [Candidatus Electrothrix sp. AR3]